MVIEEVVEGSPAALAGLRVGDTITHLNGRPSSQKLFATLPETLEPGDLVPIVVRRRGRPLELTLEATARPRTQVMVGPDLQKMVIKLDTVRGAILKDLDSIRVSLAGLYLDDPTARIDLRLLRPSFPEGDLGGRRTVFRFGDFFSDTLDPSLSEHFMFDPGFSMPFEALVVESPETRSLREELSRVRRELNAVRRQEFDRQRELTATVHGPPDELLRTDALLRQLQAREEELEDRTEVLSDRLARLSEDEIRRRWIQVEGRAQEAFSEAQRQWAQAEARADPTRDREERAQASQEAYRYYQELGRSPVILGQNFVLGADLKPLTPAMAEILSADRGVVVYEVIDGTPAADSGLQDLDVIVQVGGEEIVSISDLRMSLGLLQQGPLRIRLIRKGQPVVITIQR